MGGVLFFAWFRQKKAGEVARGVHATQDFIRHYRE